MAVNWNNVGRAVGGLGTYLGTAVVITAAMSALLSRSCDKHYEFETVKPDPTRVKAALPEKNVDAYLVKDADLSKPNPAQVAPALYQAQQVVR